MTLVLKVRQNKRKRNTVIALRVSFTRGVFHHSCFLKAFGDASEQTWMLWDTPLHFSRCVAGLIRCEGTPLFFSALGGRGLVWIGRGRMEEMGWVSVI